MEIGLELERVTRQFANITVNIDDYVTTEISSTDFDGTVLRVDFESVEINIEDIVDDADWQDLGEPDTIELVGSNY